MTDIVERLRAWEPLISGGYEVPAAGMALHEAAAEIERLRTLNAEVEAVLEYYADPYDWLYSHKDRPAVPDFYDELNFGERADEMLAKMRVSTTSLE